MLYPGGGYPGSFLGAGASSGAIYLLTHDVKATIELGGWLDVGFTIYRGFLPAEPDKVVALFETSGLRDETVFADVRGTIEQPGLMVVTRGAPNDYDVARLQAERIKQGLCGLGAFVAHTTSGTRYLNFDLQQPIFPRRRDGNKRPEFGMNFIVWKELNALESEAT